MYVCCKIYTFKAECNPKIIALRFLPAMLKKTICLSPSATVLKYMVKYEKWWPFTCSLSITLCVNAINFQNKLLLVPTIIRPNLWHDLLSWVQPEELNLFSPFPSSPACARGAECIHAYPRLWQWGMFPRPNNILIIRYCHHLSCCRCLLVFIVHGSVEWHLVHVPCASHVCTN